MVSGARRDYRTWSRRLRAKHAELYERRGELARESERGRIERARVPLVVGRAPDPRVGRASPAHHPLGRAEPVTPRLLIWTETYWVGGSDRFVVDLLNGLDGEFDVVLAGNPLPEFDAWLSERVPWTLPRVTIPIANLVDSPLAPAATGRAGPARAAAEHSTASTPASRCRSPGRRGGHALAPRRNHVRLRRLLRGRARRVFVNNGGYPGGESCRWRRSPATEGVPHRAVVHNMA